MKDGFTKRCQKLSFKKNKKIARWQVILSFFDFDIDFIKGDQFFFFLNFLTRKFLQGSK